MVESRVLCGAQVRALESQELRSCIGSFLPDSQPGIVIIFKLLKELLLAAGCTFIFPIAFLGDG